PSIDATFRIRKRALHLLARLTGEEIARDNRRYFTRDVRQLLTCLEFVTLGKLALQRIETLNDFAIFPSSVEELDNRCLLFGRIRLEGHNVTRTTRGGDLAGLLFKSRSGVIRDRQHIDPVAH